MQMFEFTNGAMKAPVNLNADGNIAQTGETAAGTKTLSLLNVNVTAVVDADTATPVTVVPIFDFFSSMVSILYGTTPSTTGMYVSTQMKLTAAGVQALEERRAQANGNSDN